MASKNDARDGIRFSQLRLFVTPYLASKSLCDLLKPLYCTGRDFPRRVYNEWNGSSTHVVAENDYSKTRIYSITPASPARVMDGISADIWYGILNLSLHIKNRVTLLYREWLKRKPANELKNEYLRLITYFLRIIISLYKY